MTPRQLAELAIAEEITKARHQRRPNHRTGRMYQVMPTAIGILEALDAAGLEVVFARPREAESAINRKGA